MADASVTLSGLSSWGDTKPDASAPSSGEQEGAAAEAATVLSLGSQNGDARADASVPS